MNTNFKEGQRYLVEQSIFNRSILTCHCVQDDWAYLSDTPSSQIYTEKVEYKYNIKKGRMYVFNKAFQVWDSAETYTLTEYGSNVNTGYETYKVI